VASMGARGLGFNGLKIKNNVDYDAILVATHGYLLVKLGFLLMNSI